MNPADLSNHEAAALRPADMPVPRWIVWYQRVSMALRVVLFIYIGLVLIVVPWTRPWTENSLLAAYPGIRDFLQLNFVRGLVTGLGLVDLWFGITEAVQYRDPKHLSDLPEWLR